MHAYPLLFGLLLLFMGCRRVLEGNQLIGSIPECIGNLSSLTQLYARSLSRLDTTRTQQSL
jgi:hypothetical protein